jgi:ribosomal protein S18 acetylase RimI-like enzyme
VLTVSVVQDVTDDVVHAVQRLVRQLSTSAAVPTDAQVAEIIRSPATTLVVARDDEVGTGPADGLSARGPEGPVVGMVTLVAFRIPTGVRAWVEDVVVDDAARRRGVGEALVRAAVEVATTRGARTVDLTSRPSRREANRLYERAGFEARETNVYRYTGH